MFNKKKEITEVLEFQDDYRFLSNMWMCPVYYDNRLWHSAEHAYQAAKTNVATEKDSIMACDTPYAAKKLGRTVTLREDWEEVRLTIMYEIIESKFSLSPLREMLLDTGEMMLTEGNKWKDTFWGVCDGVGHNHLGRILMTTRINIRRNLTL